MIGISPPRCYKCGDGLDCLTDNLCHKCDRETGLKIHFFKDGKKTHDEKIGLIRLILIIIIQWKTWKSFTFKR